MSRIEMLSVDDARKAAAEVGVLEQLAELNVFRVLLHRPRIAKALNDLLLALLRGEAFPARLRELAIMRIGWRTASNYEWTQHWAIALGSGLSETEVLGVRDWRAFAGYTPADRAVLAATDDVLDTGTVTDEVWAQCREHVGGDPALVEMVIAIGNWRLFSSTLRSLGVALEDRFESWPPDGVAPPGPAAQRRA